MPIGVLTDNLCVALGGIIGSLIGPRIPERVKGALNQVFGFCSLAIGITLVMKVSALGAVVLSAVVGTLVGSLCRLEDRVNGFFAGVNDRLFRKNRPDEEYMSMFLTLLVLACCSGTGIFGAMDEAMTGNSTTIICKAILDFFTVIIFAASLGAFTSIIAIPQMIILLSLFYCAKLILPALTDTMIRDFSAVGGVLELILGMRILKLTKFKALDFLPALLLIFPISQLWQNLF